MVLCQQSGNTPTDHRWIKKSQGGQATAAGGAFDLGAIRECKRLPVTLWVSQLRMEEGRECFLQGRPETGRP